MTAMRNASKNAGELIDRLTLRHEPRPPGGDHAGDPRGRRPARTRSRRHRPSLRSYRDVESRANGSVRACVVCFRPLVSTTRSNTEVLGSGAGLAGTDRRGVGRPSSARTSDVKARGYWEQVWRRFKRDRVAIASVFFLVFLVLAASRAPGSRSSCSATARTISSSTASTTRLIPVGPWTYVTDPLTGETQLFILGADGHARPRRVPAAALRRPGLARGGGPLDDRRDAHRHDARRDRRLLPRLDRHDRLAPDRDHDGVPGAAVHHRARQHGRQPARQRHVRRRPRQGRRDARPRLLGSSAGSTRRGSSARRCSRCGRRSSSRRRAWRARATGGSSARTCCRTWWRRSSSSRRWSSPATSSPRRRSRSSASASSCPRASWGNLLSRAPEFYTSQPWLMVWPGLAVLLTTLAFNLLGDGLRDAFDPRGRL